MLIEVVWPASAPQNHYSISCLLKHKNELKLSIQLNIFHVSVSICLSQKQKNIDFIEFLCFNESKEKVSQPK